MFWTAIRWGGTATIIVLVLVAAFFASQNSTPTATAIPVEGEATPVEITPADDAPQQNKNFNL